MSKARRRLKAKRRVAEWAKRNIGGPTCPACGEKGSHFVPPSLGEIGFYACTPPADVVNHTRCREPYDHVNGLHR